MSKASIKSKTPKGKKSVVKIPKILSSNAKIRKKPEYKSFRIHRPVKRPDLKISSWREITKKALKLVKQNARPLGWFFLIYGLLYLVLVRGITSPVDIESIKGEITDATGVGASSLITNITVMSVLFQSATSSSSDVAVLYQLMFLIASTLALIWLFRQQQAGNMASMKEAFYRGMYPMVPFVLVTLVIALQTLPASIGNFLFTTVNENGIAVSAFEQFIWVLFFAAMLLLSLYMISSSVIALFIVTLPDMTPMLALRKAKELVTFRRANVLGKVLILILIIAFFYVSAVLPAIFISAAVAQVVFFFLGVFIIPFSVAYLFVLYRELL